MATLSLYSAFQFTVGNDVIKGGNRAGAYSITVDGRYQRMSKSLATATTWEAWETADDNTSPSNFDFLWILSDKAVFVEFTVDKGNEVGDETFILEAQANVPLILTSDDAAALYVSITSFTEDVIDRIRIRNNSGDTAAIDFCIVT